ncbi:hypothetical protein [Natrialba sp. INN-245]|uniref:hypothetical protein n=1 Tax=Natrialba sp. INN-245 TaxID=2690967 RepID=UPI001310350D|nr:hypothetical protein [Natrialba sp. INN-245]MWV40213.1 hypothetical protein [Natrialba sp. INN-245]
MLSLLLPRQKGLARQYRIAFDQRALPGSRHDVGRPPRETHLATPPVTGRGLEQTTGAIPMTASRVPAVAAGSDDRSDRVCARCSDPIADGQVIYLQAVPCVELTERYGSVTEPYCPDCIAAIGMLSFSTATRGHAPTNSD